MLAIFVLTAVIRRNLFVARMTHRWLNLMHDADPNVDAFAHNTADHELNLIALKARQAYPTVSSVLDDEVDRIRQETERSVYDVYWFVSGMLPSLGFIGTVVGMSAALLKADRLFSAADRPLAISEMTKELGLAFDTTLVALVMGLLVSVPLSILRGRELTFYRAFAQRFNGRRPDHTSIEAISR